MATTFTEIEKNNCFSAYTRSDLNKIRKETINAANSKCAKVRFLQYFQTGQIIVFVSFSINGLKENVQSLDYCSFREETLRFNCFFQLTVNGKGFFLLANAVNSGYRRGESCLSVVFFALFTC